MKTLSDRIHRNISGPRTSTAISIRLPDNVLDDLKELAPLLGYSGYQALLKAYVGKGLRDDLIRLERERVATGITSSLAEQGITHKETVGHIVQGALKAHGFEAAAGEPPRPPMLGLTYADRIVGVLPQEVQAREISGGSEFMLDTVSER